MWGVSVTEKNSWTSHLWGRWWRQSGGNAPFAPAAAGSSFIQLSGITEMLHSNLSTSFTLKRGVCAAWCIDAWRVMWFVWWWMAGAEYRNELPVWLNTQLKRSVTSLKILICFMCKVVVFFFWNVIEILMIWNRFPERRMLYVLLRNKNHLSPC